MKKFLTSFADEFQTFIARGNVIDLAVAVILAGAFGAIIESFTAILTGIIGALFGQPDFAEFTIYGIPFGPFINAVVNFLLVALALFFFLKAYNALRQRLRKTEGPAVPEKAVPLSPEVVLLQEIRDLLKSGPNDKPVS
jgi:large conductance mechanosensitive channel